MILDDIIAKRKEQLQREKAEIPEAQLISEAKHCIRTPLDFSQSLVRSGFGIIAEVKKASPSKGIICREFCPRKIAHAYEAGGAQAISCLTEEHYFQGGAEYFRQVRETVSLPMLRKDFIIEPYQIYEAKLLGADAVLLIAAVLSSTELEHFRKIAEFLGMQALTEVHNREELKAASSAGCTLIGINNRNLHTFEVNLRTTQELAADCSSGAVIVAESGIRSAEDIAFLKDCGAKAALVGETLMRSQNISEELSSLRSKL